MRKISIETKTNRIPGAPILMGMILACVILPSAADAACVANDGASGPHSSLWGALEPTEPEGVHKDRDSTNYNGSQATDYRWPLFTSVDVEGDLAFTSYSFGVQVWDLSGPKADAPILLTYRDQGQGHFPKGIGYQETRWLLWDVDAPASRTDVFAAVGLSPFSMVIVDSRDPKNAKIVYQDAVNRKSLAVWSAVVAGRPYAFNAVDEPAAEAGIHVYDLQTARDLSTPCLEDTGSRSSCGVYKGKIQGSDEAKFLDGFVYGGKTYLVSASFSPKGVQVWDVTSPLQPKTVNGGSRLFDSSYRYGVAGWVQDGTPYLASLTTTALEVHDLGACLSGGGCSNPRLVASAPFASAATNRFVTYSKDGNAGYLYVGVDDKCSGGLARERLYGLSGIETSGLEDLSPTHTITLDGIELDYWGWYYTGNYSTSSGSGFNQVMPRVGKVRGGHLYRAAWTLFDVHRLMAVGPAISLSAPDTAYSGDTVNLQASAENCTPTSGAWSWSVGDGDIQGSSTGSAISVVWPSTGTKSVTVTNPGCSGASGEESVTVVTPLPTLSEISVSPNPALRCQEVQLTPQNLLGKPPLTCAWSIQNDQAVEVGTGSGCSGYAFDSTNADPGSYTGHLRVTNGTGDLADFEAPFSVDALGDPAFTHPTGAPTFSPNPPPGSFVQFDVQTQGATEWSWDFGDGGGFGAWSSDPATGPKPTHDYFDSGLGSYEVKAQIRNCVQTTPVISAPVTVEITQLEPLVALFECKNNLSFCTGEVGQSLTFQDKSSGNPETWDYDWDGNGTFEVMGRTSPVTSHAYSKEGSYKPRLRVWRGGESDVYVHANVTISDPTPPPPAKITVNGASSGDIGQTLQFSASASNCTANPSGWSWSVSGGSISGAATGGSVQVSWSSAGSKTVTAKNSTCGSASGSKSVSITDPNSGGDGTAACSSVGPGGLQACFSFTPSSPEAGSAVSFDGSGSGGSPTLYSWDFGDGTTIDDGPAKPQHTYTKAGTYKVRLTVGKKVSGAGCMLDHCSVSKERTVTVIVDDGGGDGGGGGSEELCGSAGPGGLQACFGATPDPAGFGTPVSFDGSSSKGSPSTYTWRFGDGTGALSGSAKTVDHTFAKAGSYEVTLEVSKSVPGSGCMLDYCTVSHTRTFEVLEEAPTCSDSETGICLKQGRFRVEAEWWNDQGESGQATPVRLTEDTAYFWFFQRSNVEIVAKILDGTSHTGHYWVYYASLSSVGFEIKVTDTETGNSKTYRNESGSMASRGDVKALPSTEPTGEGLTFVNVEPSSLGLIPLGEASHEDDGACEATESRLCLGGDKRWEVDVTFVDRDGVTRQGRAEILTSLTGYFWFFKSTNVELIAKILDGRKVNGKYWVFYASLTDLEFDMTVTDLHTGAQATYHNDAGVLASHGDIDALPGH